MKAPSLWLFAIGALAVVCPLSAQVAPSYSLQQAAAGAVVQKLVVSESGASIYSASEFASKELPELDVSLRGAVSIARRLQDPLAELVKIEPKSIGVGQYQHDVNQSGLARSLDAVVEDCVHAVGVDLNTASAPLLARVSGLSPVVAASIVRWRDAHGAFRNRKQLLDVAGVRHARAALAAETFCLVLSDIGLADGNGIALCTEIKTANPDLPVVLISATYRTADVQRDALQAGADAILSDPVSPDQLLRVIGQLCPSH